MFKGIAAGLAVAQIVLGASATPLSGQASDPIEPFVQRAYESVRGSVVRLRTDASVELTLTDPHSGLRSVVKRPLSVHGSGVVIGETVVNGRREYLVLTNHHVADPTNYVVQEGRFLKENRHNTRAVPEFPEESFLTSSEDGSEGADDIRLVEISRVVRGDMTLMQTVGADRKLQVFAGLIGFEYGSVRPGTPVLTTGFPNGGARLDDTGTVVDIDRVHELGEAHEDFVLSVPVEHGQSGSPVFISEQVWADEGLRVEFRLIGMLHAREEGTSYMVPTHLWQHALRLNEDSDHRGTPPELLADATH